MSDLSHVWSGDLSLSATGDLLGTAGSEMGRQRVLRRLLTAEGAYIWHPDYGAGLPSRVGTVQQPAEIEAAARVQMLQERAVSQDPLPQVDATGSVGTITLSIAYRDAETAEPVAVGFTLRE